MGGPGSGGWVRWEKKGTVEDHQRIDVRELHKKHGIKPGSQMTVQYERRGEQVAQEVFLDWTVCNFGGYRPWLICMNCGRRVVVLYLKNKYFACRHCHDLTYQSCQESDSRYGSLLRNCDGFDSSEVGNLPLSVLRGYLNRTWKVKDRFQKKWPKRRRGRPPKRVSEG